MTPSTPPVYGIIIFSDSQKIYLTENEVYALFYGYDNPSESFHEFFLSLPKEYGTENRIIYFHGFDEEITIYDANLYCEFQTTPRDMFIYEYGDNNVEFHYLLRFAKFNFGFIIDCSIDRYRYIINMTEPQIETYDQFYTTLGDVLNFALNFHDING
jgi:hypothetical protein